MSHPGHRRQGGDSLLRSGIPGEARLAETPTSLAHRAAPWFGAARTWPVKPREYYDGGRDQLIQWLGRTGGAMPYHVLLAEARDTIAMHKQVEQVGTTYDRHTRWRDMIVSQGVYQRQRCKSCTDNGCAQLRTALLFEEIVAPLVAAEAGRGPP